MRVECWKYIKATLEKKNLLSQSHKQSSKTARSLKKKNEQIFYRFVQKNGMLRTRERQSWAHKKDKKHIPLKENSLEMKWAIFLVRSLEKFLFFFFSFSFLEVWLKPCLLLNRVQATTFYTYAKIKAWEFVLWEGKEKRSRLFKTANILRIEMLWIVKRTFQKFETRKKKYGWKFT